MRRIEINRAINNIKDALLKSNMPNALISLQKADDKTSPEQLLDAFNIYKIFYLNFNKTEKAIIKLFSLNGLEDTKLWAQAISGANVGEVKSIFRRFYNSIVFFENHLTPLLELFKQDNIGYTERKDDLIAEYDGDNENTQLLTIILPEEDHKISSKPDRLIKALSSTNAFYGVLSGLMGHSGNDLSVIAIDSGSDKSFDFLGAAKVVEAVKELIIGMWDRVVFHKEKKIEERIEIISDSLPVLEKINLLEKEDKISQQQAEIYRRALLGGVKDFLSAGAILPEFTAHSSYNPRQLMAPEVKLLSMPSEVKNDTSTIDGGPTPDLDENSYEDDDEEGLGDVSEEDFEAFKKFMARRKKKKGN
ncbi:hypothetical protein IC229_16790 [Spirosoma sp. BT702]|uniref:Uncharacterized protein n=1 Tax=Spirosoma profusum TaxID=2771354 RepID=A0A926XX87_9BACT|nr:hypothetical protein [Spirosoma profusum]MBD2702309.1 hypothetical protein [Spirosoma profusum]